jgi:2-methylcitrate dehydratase PrpD
MSDPAILALRKRTTLIPNAELTTALPPRQVILRVVTKDGRDVTFRTHAVKGTPANRMSREEVVAKSLDLLEPVIGAERAEKLVEAVLHLDAATDVVALRPLLQS